MQTRTLFTVAVSLLLVTIIPLNLHSQSWRTMPWEIQAGVGSANYFGDIGGSAAENNWFGLRDIQILRSRITGQVGGRYNYSNHFSFSGTLALGWLSGNDAGGPNDARGYVFNTIIFEPMARAEYYPLRDLQMGSGLDRRGMVRNYATLSAYVWTGLGAVIYGVMPNDALEARRERDNIEHGFMTGVLPLGVGVKIGIMNVVDLGIELGGRWSFNDYLDGFTSPTATSNDIYYLTTINLVYRLKSLEEIGISR